MRLRNRDRGRHDVSREELIFLALVFAPWPLIVIVALLRGYTMTLHMRRNGKRNSNGEGG